MRRIQGILAAMGLLLTTLLGSAQATSIGFRLTLWDNVNTPKIKLQNTSDAGFDLGEFVLTIGDTAYNFDSVTASSEAKSDVGEASLLSPDRNSTGGARSDAVRYLFSDFLPGGLFSFAAELDRDSVNTSEDYRRLFFNNGDAPNAVAAVRFRNDGWERWLTLTLPDGAGDLSKYEFSATQPVPLPGSAVLLGSGVVALLATRRRPQW
ncbi:MAG: hypothetical protein HY900_20815 [Deltaproteobacteria bacterium]|nr:hypothetical protein [Deltaproteobacteria bacterium]